MKYKFRIPTCANIAYGDIETWLNDWHSLDLILMMQQDKFVWVEADIMRTLMSDIAIRLREKGLRHNGFDWEQNDSD